METTTVATIAAAWRFWEQDDESVVVHNGAHPVNNNNITTRTVVAYLLGLIILYRLGYYVLTFHVFRQSVVCV